MSHNLDLMLFYELKVSLVIDQVAKPMAMRALYNICNVPDVYYCNKYETISCLTVLLNPINIYILCKYCIIYIFKIRHIYLH